jgi:hypothetical protein
MREMLVVRRGDGFRCLQDDLARPAAKPCCVLVVAR